MIERARSELHLLLSGDKAFSGAPDSGQLIALGRWCLSDPARDDPEMEILPYEFDDRAKLFTAYKYLDGVYTSLMPKLIPVLNGISGEDHGQRYWEILIGYWLREYLEILYERYRCVRMALKHVPDASVSLLDKSCWLTVATALEFDRRQSSDLYNHQLYSQIIGHIGGFNCTYIKIDRGRWDEGDKLSLRKRLTGNAKDAVRWGCVLGSRRNRIFFILDLSFSSRAIETCCPSQDISNAGYALLQEQ